MHTQSSSEAQRGSIYQATCLSTDQMSDLEASQSSPALLPKRPKQPKHQTSMNNIRHRRAQTAQQYRDGSLSSCSSSSLLTFSSGEETNRSSVSSHRAQHPGSRAYSCHISCRVSPDKPGYFEYLRPYSVYRTPLKRSRSLPQSFSDSYCLQHPDLNNGQKIYLWHTAAVYSMTNMKALQERRYKQLLQHQVDIGFHTQEECDRYLSYLLGTRKRQYMADSRVWRDPPKIPVRQKSFHLPPPSKSHSPRDYRFFPKGYKDISEGQGDNEEGNRESKCQKQETNQGGDKEKTKGKGWIEGEGEAEPNSQVDGKQEANTDGKKDRSNNQDEGLHSDSDENNLSESMQGMSLYYDTQRKTTVTRGGKENDGEPINENVDMEGNQKSPRLKISHQDCFWGSH